jgi:PAS domain S-box-containing protein
MVTGNMDGSWEARHEAWATPEVARLFDLVRDGVLVLDEHEVIRYANPIVATRLGAAPSDLLGRPLGAAVPGLDDTGLRRLIDEATSTASPTFTVEYLPLLAEWLEVQAAPVDRGTLLLIREVTEHRRSEHHRAIIRAVDEAITATTSVTDTVAAVLRVLRAQTDFPYAEAWHLPRGADRLQLLATDHDEGDARLAAFSEFSRHLTLDRESVPFRTLVTGDPVAVDRYTVDPALPRAVAAGDAGLTSSVHIPLRLGGDHRVVVGLMRRAALDSDDSRRVVEGLGDHLSTVLERHGAQLELARLFHVSRDYVVIATTDGNLRRVNTAIADAIGLPAENLVGRSITEFVHPEDHDLLVESMQQLVAGLFDAPGAEPDDGRTPELTLRMFAAQGAIRSVSWTAQVDLTRDLVYATGRDVTAELADRRFQDELNEILELVAAGEPVAHSLDRLLRALERELDDTRAAAVVLRPVERPGEATDAARLGPLVAPTLDRTVAVSLRSQLADLATWDIPTATGPTPDTADHTGAGAIVHALRDGHRAIATELGPAAAHTPADPVARAAIDAGHRACWADPVVDADGLVLGALVLFRDAPGAPTTGDLARAHDAIQVARIAIQREAADLERRASNERFRLLADVTSDAIFDWDLTTGTLWRSEGFRTLFGHVAEEETSDRFDIEWWWARIHPDDLPALERDVLRLIRGGAEHWRSEYRFRRADGSLADVVISVRVVRRAGRAVRLVGSMSDVTEQRQLERQYLRAQRVESLGTLAGGIAHDLNNTLTPILLAAESLRAELEDPTVVRTLDTIETAARRGSDMVRQILTFAKGVDGERTPVRLDHVIMEVLRLLDDTFPKNVELHADLADGPATVLGDATQLHQVLVNLALNARDAMPDGGTLRFELAERTVEPAPRSLPPGHYWTVDVVDSGIGIPAAVRERLFEPFFSTKRRVDGSGLGLATSLAIVRSHGGEIEVATRVGEGTRFTVLLPATSSEPLPDHTPSAPPAPTRRSTIVVVDDEPAVRDITRDVLVDAGYDVIAVSGGAEALEAYQRHGAVDMVLTDVMMPGMDGAELAAALVALDPSVRVAAMTGLDDPRRAERLRRAGIERVLGKPFDRRGLLDTVAETLAEERPPRPIG